nr:MAG TPA: hypothetical protein [Caudoviricetes sp.]
MVRAVPVVCLSCSFVDGYIISLILGKVNT